jgi:hypothetical protein
MSEVALVVPAQVEVVTRVALAPLHASAGGMQQLVPTDASYSANTIDQAMIIDNQQVEIAALRSRLGDPPTAVAADAAEETIGDEDETLDHFTSQLALYPNY